ncbi:hypothetical protein [Massilia endophytica]|uniref:hypothetical protein n=1 Tax=Massilia endophytica TaxID=2899220 RepID=UPI001E4FC471|nr:hypothetical protein [Massilia endophytica]UGQ47410.1 hypothetical protein LSQ66_02700 [Massilia endophytica]
MQAFRILLLAFLLVFGTSVAVAKSVHTCCAGGDCAITQCVDMGCAPVCAPMAAADTYAVAAAPVRDAFPALETGAPPELAEEIWTPPD